ncbi:MAG: hypothetical protein ACRCWF_04200 [Beijerinckiaceae bacterium]
MRWFASKCSLCLWVLAALIGISLLAQPAVADCADDVRQAFEKFREAPVLEFEVTDDPFGSNRRLSKCGRIDFHNQIEDTFNCPGKNPYEFRQQFRDSQEWTRDQLGWRAPKSGAAPGTSTNQPLLYPPMHLRFFPKDPPVNAYTCPQKVEKEGRQLVAFERTIKGYHSSLWSERQILYLDEDSRLPVRVELTRVGEDQISSITRYKPASTPTEVPVFQPERRRELSKAKYERAVQVSDQQCRARLADVLRRSWEAPFQFTVNSWVHNGGDSLLGAYQPTGAFYLSRRIGDAAALIAVTSENVLWIKWHDVAVQAGRQGPIWLDQPRSWWPTNNDSGITRDDLLGHRNEATGFTRMSRFSEPVSYVKRFLFNEFHLSTDVKCPRADAIEFNLYMIKQTSDYEGAEYAGEYEEVAPIKLDLDQASRISRIEFCTEDCMFGIGPRYMVEKRTYDVAVDIPKVE